MFINSKVNGFFLLLNFGLVCGLTAGALFGFGLALYLGITSRVSDFIPALFVFSGIGAAYGLVPGILYGLSSYYFKNQFDWLLAGAVYGAIPSFTLVMLFGWYLLLICMSYGVLVGFVNRRFPTWWGMRLRAEGIELLSRNN